MKWTREGVKVGFSGKGVEWYWESAADIERAFEDLQARVALVAPTDQRALDRLVREGREIVASLKTLDGDLSTELAELWAFHDREAGRVAAGLFTTFLDPSAKARYRHGFEMASIEYEQCHDAMTLALTTWQSWLSAVNPPSTSLAGAAICGAGHENHPSRRACILCGLPLGSAVDNSLRSAIELG